MVVGRPEVVRRPEMVGRPVPGQFRARDELVFRGGDGENGQIRTILSMERVGKGGKS